MIRKYLFWGLTLVLLVAIINLIVRGRRLEKEQAAKGNEIVQQSKPEATRVISPRDLAVSTAAMRLEPGGTARHSVEIRNTGSHPYSRIQIRFVYLDASSKTVAERTHIIAETIKPGALLRSDIVIKEAPSSAVRSEASILYADLAND